MGVRTNSGLGDDNYRANRTYHVTARAIGNLRPFADDQQKAEVLARFGNHLAAEPAMNQWRKPYVKLIDEVRSLSFNVLDNHLHKLAHQFTADGITRLMSRVMARQADSYNRRTGWRGKVFSGFDATEFEEMLDPTQIKDMVAYIELNDPIRQFETPFASYQVIAGNLECEWYDPQYVLAVFGGIDNYREHMNRRGPAIVRNKLLERGIDPRRHPYRPI